MGELYVDGTGRGDRARSRAGQGAFSPSLAIQRSESSSGEVCEIGITRCEHPVASESVKWGFSMAHNDKEW